MKKTGLNLLNCIYPSRRPFVRSIIPDEVRCQQCKQEWDLSILRERQDYKAGICPKCGGKLVSTWEKRYKEGAK